MNIFRMLGDMSHLAAMLLLLMKIWNTRSCRGLSLKSQALYMVVFICRYTDVLTHFVSLYNTSMKLLFLAIQGFTVYLMARKFRVTYDSAHDTFPLSYIVAPPALLALIFNYEFTVIEVLWAFSEYLEAVAIFPQLFMVQRTGEAESITSHYLFALGMYRAFYLPNWAYRWYFESHLDLVSVLPGLVQTALYADFFYLYITKVLSGRKLVLPA